MTSTKSVLLKWSSALGLGVAAAFAYYMHFLQIPLRAPGEQLFVLIYLIGLFTLLAFGVLFRFVAPRLSGFSRRATATWFLIAFLTGAYLLLAIPVKMPTATSIHQLEVVATGQKNPAAQGSEVWLTGFLQNDGTALPAADFQLDGTWEVRDGVPVSYQHQPAVLRWQGQLDGSATLRMLAHPWSGIVTITWDGVSQTIDLYADPGTQKEVRLAVGTSAPGLSLLIFLADAIVLGLGILTLSVWLGTRPVKPKAVQVRRWSWVAYALPCIAIWSVYLLAYWPGLMSPDSLDQWSQVLTGHFNNAHPAIHTLTIWLVTRLLLSPTAVALMQIAFLSTIFGATMQELARWGVPVAVRLIITALFALSPVNGLMVITIWKDVAYTIALLGVFSILLCLVRTRGKWLHSLRHTTILCGALACVALYRYNGLPVAILLVGALVIWLKSRRERLRILAIASIAIILYVAITGPLYDLLKVTPMSPLFASQQLVHQVGAIVQERETFTESDRVLLAGIQPLAVWKRTYNCYSLNPLIYNGAVNPDYFDVHVVQFRELWLRYLLQDSKSILQHQECVSSLIWQVMQPPTGYLDTVPSTPISSNTAGLVSNSQLPAVQSFLIRLANQVRQPSYIWWAWRPALYLYLTLLIIVTTAIRLRRKSILVLALPSILNSLILLALITVQDFRFQYPIYVIGLITPALLFIHTRLELPANAGKSI